MVDMKRSDLPALRYSAILTAVVGSLDLLHKSEKLAISNFGFWILDFGLRDLGLLQEVF
jgi:hypothetical protein